MTKELLKFLYLKWDAIYLEDPSYRNQHIRSSLSHALSHTINAEQQLETADYYYNIYLDLLNHP